MRKSSIQQDNLDRLFGWWYDIAAPSVRLKSLSRYQDPSIRKGRYISLVLLIEMVSISLVYFVNVGPSFMFLTISLIMMIIGVYLNRIGRTLASGWIVFMTIEVSLTLYVLSLGLVGSGLSLTALPILVLLVQPQLVAVSLFSPKVSLSIAAFNCAFVAAAISFLPKDHEMMLYLAKAPFDVYFPPIITLAVVSLVSLIWAKSALQEMQRAAQSDELSELARDVMNNPILLKEMLERVERKGGSFRGFIREKRSPEDNYDLW